MFESTGSTITIQNAGHPQAIHVNETIKPVRQSISENPKLSVCKRNQALNLKKPSLHVILKCDIHLKAYKIQLMQELKKTD